MKKSKVNFLLENMKYTDLLSSSKNPITLLDMYLSLSRELWRVERYAASKKKSKYYAKYYT